MAGFVDRRKPAHCPGRGFRFIFRVVVTFAEFKRDYVPGTPCDSVLVSTQGAPEKVLRDRDDRQDSTMVFMHETISIMRAERAEQLEKLRSVVHSNSVLIPLRKRVESLWEHIAIGRAPTSDIVLEDPAVSSVHANFLLTSDGSVSVQDVGSSNGSFLNREPLQPHVPTPVRSGDCIRFGQTILYYIHYETLQQLVTSQ